MAEASAKLSRMPEALAHADSATSFAKRKGETAVLAASDVVRGQVYVWSGDLDRASHCYEAASTGFFRIGAIQRMADCTREIGWIFYLQQRYDMAMERYHVAQREYRRIGDLAGEARVLRSKGLVYCDSSGDKTYRIGLAYIDSSIALSLKAADHAGLAAAYSNKGSVFLYQGKLNASRQQLDSALFHARKARDVRLLASVMGRVGDWYLNNGDLRKAYELCSATSAQAKTNRMLLLERDAANCLYQALRDLGKHEQANGWLWTYIALRDSMVNMKSRDAILRRSVEESASRRLFEDSMRHAAEMGIAASEKQVERLRSERYRSQMIALGFGGLFLACVGVLLYRVDRKRRRERFERDSARLQTQVLRTQMNPHFIFNALNSINNYVQENERDLASGFLTKFARLMRLVLENSRHEEVPMTQDLEALRLYMDLEQARMSNRFKYEVHVDQAIDQDNTMVPPLVLQPFVENAIWHGLSRKDGAGLLKLSVRQVAGMLIMTVEDDGVGRDAATSATDPSAPPKTSMGTGITQERLAMLGKQRGGEAGFHYVEVHKGTCVEVLFPIAPAASS